MKSSGKILNPITVRVVAFDTFAVLYKGTKVRDIKHKDTRWFFGACPPGASFWTQCSTRDDLAKALGYVPRKAKVAE